MAGVADQRPHLWLLGRPWCSLCDTMAERLRQWGASHDVTFTIVDVDEHVIWLPLFDERIPVVVTASLAGHTPDPGTHVVVCEGRFDSRACDAWLSARTKGSELPVT